MRSLMMIKSWLVAAGLFLVGIVCALFMGKAKQANADKKQAAVVVNDELNKIAKVRNDAQQDVQNKPPTNLDSPADPLRDDWSER